MRRQWPKRPEGRPRCDRCGRRHRLREYVVLTRPMQLCESCARHVDERGWLTPPDAAAVTEARHA